MIYSKEVIAYQTNQVSCAVNRYILKKREEKVLKISEINLHEMLVESMCQFPYELRFGKVYDAFFAYLLKQPEDIKVFLMSNVLDTLYSVLMDLVESKDIKKRTVGEQGDFLRVDYFSLREGLVIKGRVGYSLFRNREEPLNYQSGGGIG